MPHFRCRQLRRPHVARPLSLGLRGCKALALTYVRLSSTCDFYCAVFHGAASENGSNRSLFRKVSSSSTRTLCPFAVCRGKSIPMISSQCDLSLCACRQRQFGEVENWGFWWWTFEVKGEDGGNVAVIDRNWRGFGYEVRRTNESCEEPGRNLMNNGLLPASTRSMYGLRSACKHKSDRCS
jgi:hypothetical protein